MTKPMLLQLLDQIKNFKNHVNDLIASSQTMFTEQESCLFHEQKSSKRMDHMYIC